jgi:hypothetical protein
MAVVADPGYRRQFGGDPREHREIRLGVEQEARALYNADLDVFHDQPNTISEPASRMAVTTASIVDL